MATREYQFVVGPETSTTPAAGVPVGPDDLTTKSYVDTADSTHASATTGVHGVGAGAVVGTTLTQQLSGKSFAQNLLPEAHGTRDIGVTGTRFKDLWLSGDANVGGNAIIAGDLTVNGTTTTLNTATVDSEDPNVTLNKGGNDASSIGAGLTIDRTGTKGSLVYDTTTASKFKAGDLASEAEILTTTHTQTISGKTFSQDIVPNATNTRDIGTSAVKYKDGWFAGDIQVDTNLRAANKAAAPSAPAAGYSIIYPKTDGKLYMIPSGGAETLIGPVVAGGALITTNSPTGSTTVAAGTTLFNPYLTISSPDTYTVSNGAKLVSVDTLTVASGATLTVDSGGEVKIL